MTIYIAPDFARDTSMVIVPWFGLINFMSVSARERLHTHTLTHTYARGEL